MTPSCLFVLFCFLFVCLFVCFFFFLRCAVCLDGGRGGESHSLFYLYIFYKVKRKEFETARYPLQIPFFFNYLDLRNLE